MTTANSVIFREYDIRGNAESDLPNSVAQRIGAAFAAHVGAGPGSHPIVVGRDCRLSSDRLFRALIDGITEMGASVVDIGVVPTPVVYFAAHHWPCAGAVVVTGSHNPAADNGFKMLRNTESMYGVAIQQLRERIAAAETSRTVARGQVETRDAVSPYLDHAVEHVLLGPRRFPVVVDAGNGAGGPTAVALYERLGFPVTALYCDMDGTFPHHHPDPTVAANLLDLTREVATTGAEVGIALDGDADRIGAVDNRGRVIWGDQLLLLFGREILKEVPHATIIGEVKCSQTVFDELAAAGANTVMWKVGHSLIKAKMKECGAALAGEMSGHIFFSHRYLGFDDGIYAGARLLELLSHSKTPLEQIYDTLPAVVNTPEIRIETDEQTKFLLVKRVQEIMAHRPDVRGIVDIDGVRATFVDGWGLIRASNTQPALVLRCEASDKTRLQAIRATLEAAVEQARQSL